EPSTVSEASDAEAGAVAAGPATVAHGGAPAGNGTSSGNGRSLLKQVRAHMVANGRPRLRDIVEDATGVPLVSVHHDISTLTGEEVIVFSLTEPPVCRMKRKV
ncbi:MAG: Na-translocating system protein MpsC family protein, partial [Pirellulales bacterium]